MPLKQQRLAAALASGGRSNRVIHDRVWNELQAIGATGSVMDFGAGSGEFAARLSACGQFTHVSAADIADYSGCLSADVEWVYADLNEPLPIRGTLFDLIISVEVIEHLENPRRIAREWGRLLKPGGALIVTTPNVESWRSIISLIFRGHFVAFTGKSYPAHITALTRLDFSRLLTEAGFIDVRYFYSDYGVIPRVTSLSWQRLSGGRLSGLRYSDNLGIVAHKPPTSGGYG